MVVRVAKMDTREAEIGMRATEKQKAKIIGKNIKNKYKTIKNNRENGNKKCHNPQ